MWMTEELFVTEIADFRHIFPSYWWRRLSFVSSVANSNLTLVGVELGGEILPL